METIEVWRGQSTTDTDGNPIQGKPVRVGTFQAMVAPTSTTDQTEENASPQTFMKKLVAISRKSGSRK